MCVVGRASIRWCMRHILALCSEKLLDISNIITHRYDAKDYEKGFEAMISGKSGKVVLDWTNISE